MKRLVFAGLLALLPTAGVAQVSGNLLSEACTSGDDFVEGFCMGLIVGTYLTSVVPATGTEICRPESADNKQLRDVVVKWLSENPEERHLDATWLVRVALSETFPCG